MKTIKIKKGYTIPILGEAEKSIKDGKTPLLQAIRPSEFKSIKPRLNVKQGDSVKAGTILFHDKINPDIQFASPAAGTVHEIVYGPKRRLDYIILAVESASSLSFDKIKKEEIAKISRDALIRSLLNAGMWPYIRQRPFSKIADPAHMPSSFFINCMDTAPLAADPEVALKDKIEEFRTGVEAVKVLAGKVNIITSGNAAASIFTGISGVSEYAFTGKHPAGLTSTHIAHIDPIAGHKVVWYANARDIVMLGEFLLKGVYPAERTVALTGKGLKENFYIKTSQGVKLGEIINSLLADPDSCRAISGNVLTGTTEGAEGFLGFYDNQICVIPETAEQRFLGWMTPGFGRPSFYKAFASTLLQPGKKYAMNSHANGEERAFVKTGDYQKVMALDIFPDFLAKSILVEDVEEMEKLGILETDPEDFALCSYICPSKIEFMEIVENGLKLMEKEI